MTLPRAVQQQVDEADALVAQLNGQTVDPTETPPNNPQPPDPTPVDPPKQQISQEPDPKPQIPEETWERKYSTLKGMYDAEVPRLHQQIREMRSEEHTSELQSH